jgi:hypothetical protein
MLEEGRGGGDREVESHRYSKNGDYVISDAQKRYWHHINFLEISTDLPETYYGRAKQKI